MPISQTITIKTSPKNAYAALTSAEKFSEVTGASAEISTEEGGVFSCFGGQVTGRHIELSPDSTIIQAWRVGPWPEGCYSIVKFDIRAVGESTNITLTHTGYPDDAEEHLQGGWHKMYWEPLKAYLE